MMATALHIIFLLQLLLLISIPWKNQYKLENGVKPWKSLQIGNFPYTSYNWGYSPLPIFLSYSLGSPLSVTAFADLFFWDLPRTTRRFQGEFWEMWATVPWVQKHRAKEKKIGGKNCRGKI